MKSPRLIEPPARTTPSGTVLIIVVSALFSVTPFFPALRAPAALAAVILAAVALFVRQVQAFDYSLLFALIVAAPAFLPSLSRWPYALLAPLVLYLSVTISIPHLRASLSWFRRGRFTRELGMFVIAISCVSGVALYLWQRLLSPDLSRHLAFMPDGDPWVYPFAGLGFAVLNAAMEEFLFRGIVMQALDSAFGPRFLSVLAQGWLFGAMHYQRGFPNGWWGVAMASVYGVMLGEIRRRSGGMLAPWLTHVFADLVIFIILAYTLL